MASRRPNGRQGRQNHHDPCQPNATTTTSGECLEAPALRIGLSRPRQRRRPCSQAPKRLGPTWARPWRRWRQAPVSCHRPRRQNHHDPSQPNATTVRSGECLETPTSHHRPRRRCQQSASRIRLGVRRPMSRRMPRPRLRRRLRRLPRRQRRRPRRRRPRRLELPWPQPRPRRQRQRLDMKLGSVGRGRRRRLLAAEPCRCLLDGEPLRLWASLPWAALVSTTILISTYRFITSCTSQHPVRTVLRWLPACGVEKTLASPRVRLWCPYGEGVDTETF